MAALYIPSSDASTRLTVDLWASICASLLHDDGRAAAVAFERVCSTFRAASRQSPAWAHALQRWCARAPPEVLARLRATSFLALDVWAADGPTLRGLPAHTLALTLPSCTALADPEARPLAHLRCLRRLTLGWSRVAAGGAPLAALGAIGALESLTLIAVDGLDDAALAVLLRPCVALTSLELRGCPQLTSACLADAAVTLPSLRRLKIIEAPAPDVAPINDAVVDALGPSCAPQLESLELWGAALGVRSLCGALRSLPLLTQLTLRTASSCRVTTLDELAAPLAAPLALEECTLHGFHFDDDGDALGRLLGAAPYLRRLGLHGCRVCPARELAAVARRSSDFDCRVSGGGSGGYDLDAVLLSARR